MIQTNSVDMCECVYCGHLANGRDVCNGDMDCHSYQCPACGKWNFVSMSIEYLCEEMEQDD